MQIVDDVMEQIKKMNAHEFNDFVVALGQFDPWLFEDGSRCTWLAGQWDAERLRNLELEKKIENINQAFNAYKELK